MALFGTGRNSASFANASVEDSPTSVQDGSHNDDPFKSCPVQFASVSSCYGDGPRIPACLECAFDADITLCDELSTLVYDGYGFCVHEGKCDAACDYAMADLAQCLFSATNCDSQNVKPSDSNHLRSAATSDNKESLSCKGQGSITFKNCNKCCSGNCKRLSSFLPSSWKKCKGPAQSAVTATPTSQPTSAHPTSVYPTSAPLSTSAPSNTPTDQPTLAQGESIVTPSTDEPLAQLSTPPPTPPATANGRRPRPSSVVVVSPVLTIEE